MTKSISLYGMINLELPKNHRRDTQALLDPSGAKYYYHDIRHKTLMTKTSLGQFSRNSETFPENALFDLSKILSPDIIAPELKFLDELLISKAAASNPKNSRSDREIGWADMLQISFALNEALNYNPTTIITNDEDILGTIKVLRKNVPGVKSYLSAISPQRYIERINGDFLKSIKAPFRIPLIKEIESQYLLSI
jgi:hypothetical protein